MKVGADKRWSYRAFRHVSIYVTWALLHTRMTPNQVTILSLAVALAGLTMVGQTGIGLAIAGCGLLLLYHLLDRVDGELARYQNRHSLLGIYLDNAGHYLTSGGVLLAAALRFSEFSDHPRLVWSIGSLGAVAAIMSRIEKHAPFHLFSQYVIERPGLVETVRAGGPLTREEAKESRGPGSRDRPGAISVLRDLLLVSTSFPVTVVILIIGLVAEAVGIELAGEAALYLIAGLQIAAYGGVEVANLSGNLGSESARLARLMEPQAGDDS